jgi:hypothetical protein
MQMRVSSHSTYPAARDAAWGADKVVAAAVGASMALMPLLRPGLAGSITFSDVTIGVAVMAAFLWLGASAHVVRFPLVLSVGIMIGAGALAGMVGNHPVIAAHAIVQDLVLLAWFLTIANVCRTPDQLAVVVGAWVWSSTAWAGLLVLAASSGMSGLAGQDSAGGRAALTFLNANQAGAYFGISLLVALAAGIPRRRGVKVLTVVLLATALTLTYSNAALGGTLVGLLVSGILHVRSERGVVQALALSLIAAVVLAGAATAFLRFDIGTSANQSDLPISRNTLGRSQRSAEDRLLRFDALRDLYLDGGVIGHGPATTKQTLADQGRPVPKSAHNDLFATLVERGVIGVVGLALFIGSLMRMTASFAARPLAPGFASVIPAPRYLAGAVVLVAVATLSHEVLHFRHVWALFGLVAAVYLWARDPARRGAPLISQPFPSTAPTPRHASV